MHRDLKLENVLLKRSGHLAICDFGTSKVLRPQVDPDDLGSTSDSKALSQRSLSIKNNSTASNDCTRDPLPVRTKSIIGTPAYMAPEMLLEQPYNFSVDWWALGVTLFTMLRARLPFDGGRSNDEEKMLWQIVKSKPRYDPSWSQATHDVLRSLLQKLPKTRIRSLRDLRQAQLFKNLDWRALEEERLQPPCAPASIHVFAALRLHYHRLPKSLGSCLMSRKAMIPCTSRRSTLVHRSHREVTNRAKETNPSGRFSAISAVVLDTIF